MRYFDHRKEARPLRNLFFSLGLFLIILSACFFGLDQISAETTEEEMASLESAIHRSVAHCYATEGFYPESLEYLKKEYGIRYDSNKFFVDYQIWGENMMPDITIIQK